MLINGQLQGRTQVACIAVPLLVAEVCAHEGMDILRWRVVDNKACKNFTRCGCSTPQWRLWTRSYGFRYLVPCARRNRRRCGSHPRKIPVRRTLKCRECTYPDECLSRTQKAVRELGSPVRQLQGRKEVATNRIPEVTSCLRVGRYNVGGNDSRGDVGDFVEVDLNGQELTSQSSYSFDEFFDEGRFRQYKILGARFFLLVSVSGLGLAGLVERSEAASASCSAFSGSIVLLPLAEDDGIHGSSRGQGLGLREVT